MQQMEDKIDQVAPLENKLQQLEDEIDLIEQYEKRDTLIVSGEAKPFVASPENCKDIITKLIPGPSRGNYHRE